MALMNIRGWPVRGQPIRCLPVRGQLIIEDEPVIMDMLVTKLIRWQLVSGAYSKIIDNEYVVI